MTDREIAGRFNVSIGPHYHALLLGGAAEPVYLPAVEGRRAIIRYTRDYAQSALHEIAHWCLAGRERRRLLDYGYWYVPPPRSDRMQAAFYAVEEQVQALESLLADVCGLKFHISADQIGAESTQFAATVARRAATMVREGVRPRAQQVLAALAQAR